MKKSMIKTAFIASQPVFFAYLPFGITFGFLFEQAGFHFSLAIFMSLFCYGGSGQIVALSMLTAGESVLEIVLTVLLLNSRFMFYGLSVLDRLPKAKWKQFLTIFGLGDETYSVITAIKKRSDPEEEGEFYFYLSLFNYFYWVFATYLGAFVGHIIPFDLTGLEFVMTSLFIVLTMEQYYVTRRFEPILIASLLGLFFMLVAPGQMILLGIISSAFLFSFYHRLKVKEAT